MVGVPPWMSAGRSLPVWARVNQILAPGRDLGQAQRVGAVQDRDDEPLVDRRREADVDIGVLHDRAVLPRGVDARLLRDGRRHQPHQQIRVGDPRAGLLAGALAPRGQPAHGDLAHQVEVGCARPAGRHALGHDAPDVADAHRGGHARHRGRGHRGRDRRRGCRRPGPHRPALTHGPPRRSTPRSAASRRAFGDAAAMRGAVDRGAVGLRTLLDSRRGRARQPFPPARWPVRRPPRCPRRAVRRVRRASGDAFHPASGTDGVAARSPCAAPSRPWDPRGRSRLPHREDQRDRLPHRHDVARLRAHLPQHARGRGLDLHGHLVGLDLDDRLALGDVGRRGSSASWRTLPVSCASSSAGMMTFVGIALGWPSSGA